MNTLYHKNFPIANKTLEKIKKICYNFDVPSKWEEDSYGIADRKYE